MGKYDFVIGIGTVVIADVLWRNIPGTEVFEESIKSSTSYDTDVPRKSPFASIEHYHLGLAALLAGSRKSIYRTFINGVGAGFIFSEAGQDNPFGIGKSESEIKGNIMLTSILGGMLMVAYGSK